MGAWFQVLFHSPRRGSFRLSLTVLFPIGGRTCSALDRGRPGFGQGSSCPALLRNRATGGLGLRLRGCHPLRPRCPARSAVLGNFRLPRVSPARPYNPGTNPVWAPPSSLAATGGISIDFFSSRYLDGSLRAPGPAVLSSFGRAVRASRRAGCPIREPGDRRALAPTPGLSRPAAPFLAVRPQGIRHAPALAWPYRPFRLLLSLRQFPFPFAFNEQIYGDKGIRTPDPRLAKPML